jgi:hypothetical protein
MRRLQKFVERGSHGEEACRHAYVLQSGDLPVASKGMEWRAVEGLAPRTKCLKIRGSRQFSRWLSTKAAPS